MTSKIRIKIGAIEIEFEGSEDYMRENLPVLIETMSSINISKEVDEGSDEIAELLPDQDSSIQGLKMTTNNIATKLNVKSGSELALAACAHLCLVKGYETFKRANILAEMKEASNYYKKTFSNNLSKSLKTLVSDGKILETTKETYALDAKEKSKLMAQLNGN